MALNPTALLFGEHSAIDFARSQGLGKALEGFERLKEDNPWARQSTGHGSDWAVYEVRRVFQQPGRALRSVRVSGSHGSRQQAQDRVREQAGGKAQYSVDRFGIVRAVVEPRRQIYPSIEYLRVAAPAVVEPFELPRFANIYTGLDPSAEGLLPSA